MEGFDPFVLGGIASDHISSRDIGHISRSIPSFCSTTPMSMQKVMHVKDGNSPFNSTAFLLLLLLLPTEYLFGFRLT